MSRIVRVATQSFVLELQGALRWGQASKLTRLEHVLVSVFGPREAKMRSQTIHDRANINVEVLVAPFSTGDRRKRSRGDK